MTEAAERVTARVDRDGMLVAADPPIASLQLAAGSSVGQPIAVPQLASLARSAQSLMVALSRPVLAADDEHDLDLWVRADPDADGVTLTVERVSERPASPARLDRTARLDVDQDATEANEPEPLHWAVDASLAVTDLADGFSALVDVDEWRGLPLTRLFRLIEDEDGSLPLLAALASREDFAGQKVEPRRGGPTIVLTGTASLGPDGRFTGFSGVAKREGGDDAAAEEAADMLDEAIDSAMRSPLDLIIDAADRIVERSDGPLRSDYAGYASDIAAAGRHLLEVIRSMSRDAGSEVEPIDLGAAVVEAVALVRPIAERRGVSIETFDPDTPLEVRGERRGIVQIVANILGNAVRHSPDGGTVAVVFDEHSKRVLLTIADQGPGISRADQARIFERYEQTGSPELAAQGTGLGLAISRRLARAMGGEISLVSAPGEGARFTLELDRA